MDITGFPEIEYQSVVGLEFRGQFLNVTEFDAELIVAGTVSCRVFRVAQEFL